MTAGTTWTDATLTTKSFGDVAQVGVAYPKSIISLVDIDNDEKIEHAGPFDSLWVTLSRDGINGFINELRSLRDTVFGKDE